MYNNEKTAVTQLKEILKILRENVIKYEVIICDDKSTDNSLNLIKENFKNEKALKILSNSENRGIFKTINMLYGVASMEYIGLFSIDGDWYPKDIIKLLNTASSTRADIVIGVRNNKHYSIYRSCISFLYNFLPLMFFGVQTKDAGSIKIFKKKIFNAYTFVSHSVFCEAEFIIRTVMDNKLVVFTPIHFKKRIKKSGLGGRLNIAFSSFIDLLKLRFFLKGYNTH